MQFAVLGRFAKELGVKITQVKTIQIEGPSLGVEIDADKLRTITVAEA